MRSQPNRVQIARFDHRQNRLDELSVMFDRLGCQKLIYLAKMGYQAQNFGTTYLGLQKSYRAHSKSKRTLNPTRFERMTLWKLTGITHATAAPRVHVVKLEKMTHI